MYIGKAKGQVSGRTSNGKLMSTNFISFIFSVVSRRYFFILVPMVLSIAAPTKNARKVVKFVKGNSFPSSLFQCGLFSEDIVGCAVL